MNNNDKANLAPNKPGNFDLSNYLEDYMEEREEDEEPQDVYAELEKKDRDLMMAAELGKALLNNNEVLKKKNELLMEDFQQKIYELEQEKLSLKVKLNAVECDYDHQMKELQTDIVQLREEVKKQKIVSQEGDKNRKNLIQELSQQNEQLTTRLQEYNANERSLSLLVNNLQDQVRDKRSSMHGHLQHLEKLRSEITLLREEKSELERRLVQLTDERDNLVCTLDETQDRVMLLERHVTDQNVTISYQEQEIAELQETAASLQEKLEHLSVNQHSSNQHHIGTMHSDPGVGGSSLLAELTNTMETGVEACMPGSNAAGPRPAPPGTLWWSNGCQATEDANDDDDGEVEVDDDAIMCSLMGSDFSSPGELLTVVRGAGGARGFNLRLAGAGYLAEEGEEGDPDFVRELRAEVLEVYHQLRRMCLELSERKQSSAPGKTPDELALVEMDFRLGSLRDVLGELKGLLNDLLAYNPNPGVASSTSCHGNEEEADQPTTSASVANGQYQGLAPGSDLEQCLLMTLRSEIEERDVHVQQKEEELSRTNEELQNLEIHIENHNVDNDAIFEARKERDQALSKRNALEAELQSMKSDLEKLNEQLFLALNQKISLSQQLQEWQAMEQDDHIEIE